MEAIWKTMYDAARAVQNDRKVSDYVQAGGVAAAILSESGRIYTGVCVDTASTLGICAERNAIFHMLTRSRHAFSFYGGSVMEAIWKTMYDAARAVQNDRKVSDYVQAGGVAAAILSESGRIYTGVCVDTASTLGICAERNAIFHMLTNGEHRISKVLAVMPDGKTGAPCGACRELMVQLNPEQYRDIQIMLDYEQEKITTLGVLTPEWWI